ncbi:hypothetical protein H1S01_14370 [Heliobacterium chlorum]|uniref:Uncharacterized protein n=1 Tax=Heliobacterium chlorum TaxID=2698 RepID=A0ABR7T7X3_HELCL|nr:hypothetical protein [Heliobacterium chlorum]MBC9785676.1 hypothetical protein [Heliobacterium chlorum]
MRRCRQRTVRVITLRPGEQVIIRARCRRRRRRTCTPCTFPPTSPVVPEPEETEC